MQLLAKIKPINFLSKIVALLALPSAALAAAPLWDLNDVSILLPLPKNSSEFSSTLRSTTVSDLARGKPENLIPANVHDDLVLSLEFSDRDAVRALYPKWMAVAVRIDACFREHFTDGCQKQIRVGWQPVEFVNGKAVAGDAALHTFYAISDEVWPKALADFAALKTVPTKDLPLGIHPGFKLGGLNGKFANQFRARIKPWIAQSRMTVLAVTLPSDAGNKNIFKRFNVFKNAVYRLSPLWISYSPEIEIRYGNAASKGESTREFREALPTSLMPVSGTDDLRELLHDSREAARDRKAILRYAEAQRRIVDPTKHASLTVDCLSCHSSGMARTWLDANLNFLEKKKIQEPEFKNPGTFNLANLSAKKGSLVRLRAFGYFGAEVQILDRVIHESALVADHFNRDYPILK